MRIPLAILCCSSIIATIAWSSGPSCAAAIADTTPDGVASARARLRDAALRSAERLDAIEHVLRLRRDLLASHPTDPRRPIWLADQASDLLHEMLAHEGLGLTVMFGSPTQAQLQRARAAVREAHESAAQADAAVAQAIANLEASGQPVRNEAQQQLRRDLMEVQRDRRIPYLRGISAYLQSQLNERDSAQQRQLLALADRLLAPLPDRLQGAPALEARLYAGLSKARLGDYDAAESLFAGVARDPAATAVQVFTARMGGVINRTMRNGIRSGVDALASIEQRYSDESNPAHLFYRILLADHAFNLRRALAAEVPSPQRDQHLADAFAVYTGLLKSDLGSARETVRAVVFERLTSAVSLDDDIPLEAVPGLVTVAYADHLASVAGARRRAIALLESALQQERLDAETRPAALFVLGRALAEEGERLFAAQRFIELATHFPADYQAQRAAELGVALASDLHRQVPADEQARSTLREGLSILMAKYPNLASINRWRYAAARLALNEARYEDAVNALAQITPDAVEWPDAHFMQVSISRERALHADPSDSTGLNQQVIATIERVQPILRASMSTSNTVRAMAIRDYLGLLRVYRAEALLRMNQPQAALHALADIESEAEVSTIVIGEALRVRISAYQALRQPQDAQREIDRFARTSPQQVPHVLPAVLAAMRREVEAMLQSGRETESRELAGRTMLPTAELLERAMLDQSMEAEVGRAIAHQIAAAYLLSGRFTEAAARYDRLLRTNASAADLLLGRAESLLGMGGEQQLADAMAIYKRLAAAGPDANHEHYWLSQLRMLQIVDRVNRNTDQIAPRIERLRQQDRDFGGERFKRGFEALRMKYRGTAPS